MKHFFTLIAAAMTFMVSGWSQTVVDIVVDSEDHTLLEAAVVEAGLVDALRPKVRSPCLHPPTRRSRRWSKHFEITAEELLGHAQPG